jgi:hypothetical protein
VTENIQDHLRLDFAAIWAYVESRPLADGATLEVAARSIEVLGVGRTLLEVPAEVTALQPDRLIENRLETLGGPPLKYCLHPLCDRAPGRGFSDEHPGEGMRFLPSSIVTKLLAQRLNGDLRRLKKLVERD